jgi:hypothetical protein
MSGHNDLNGRGALGALVLTGTLGVSGFLVLPSIVIGLVTQLQYTEQQIGTVSTYQLAGIGVGSVLNLVLLRNFHWRALARLGLIALFLLDLASIFLHGNYALFGPLRGAAGVAGGICVSFAAYGLGRTRNADRSFGLFLTSQVTLAILGSVLLPGVIDRYGLGGVFGCLCALEALVLAGVTRAIPEGRWQPAAAGAGNDAMRWLLCLAVLAAIVGFFTALGAFWTYINPIGVTAGFSKQQTGFAIAIGQLAGLGGALTAAFVQIRHGRLLPVGIGVALLLGGVGWLYAGFQYTTYVVAASLFSFGWYLYLPYQYGLLAALDRDGRPQVLSNAFAGLGSGLGPFLVAGELARGYGPAYQTCAAALAASVTLMLLAMGLGRTRAVAPATA